MPELWTLELKLGSNVKQHALVIILVFAVVTLAGCCTGAKPAQSKEVSQSQIRRYPNLIANIMHDGLSFAVRMDDHDMNFLEINISEKDSAFDPSSLPTVRLRVQMTDDTVIQGAAQKHLPWVANGGWTEMEYRFALGRRASVDDIHSVTISINSQQYVLCPF